MKRVFVVLVLVVMQAALVTAASIHGTVYNLDLNPVSNVKVELSSPRQVVVAVNGTYQFEVPKGVYTLKAQLIKNGTIKADAMEEIAVTDENNYVLDLILFPVVEDQTDLLSESDQINIDEVSAETTSVSWVKISVGVAVVVVLLWFFLRKKQAPKIAHPVEPQRTVTQDDAQRVLDIIKAQGGRTTQKDIRKQTPLSEAKVSLIIAELEHKGLVEKIKQGRGNIVILK